MCQDRPHVQLEEGANLNGLFSREMERGSTKDVLLRVFGQIENFNMPMRV